MNEPSGSRRPPNGIGQTFGSYTFFHILAEGGMGVIFEAEHGAIKRKVALKIVSPKYAAREGFSAKLIDEFMHEARVMGAIDHPNVVTLYDAGIVGQCPYLAMKLVTGGDLQSLVIKHGPVREEQALTLLRDCAAGLGAVHAAGFISRDIKPANILLEANGNPRLSDFGVAVPLGEIPADNVIAGTPSYLAPEQVHHQTMDLRSDIYSLGATFFYAVTGKPPFDGSSPEEIISHLMLASAPPHLDLGNSPKARGLTQIILQAMNFQPDKRYKTTDEIVHDCATVLAGGEPEYAQIGNKRKRTFFGSLLDRATSLSF
jgi:serine/threonine-protein kinase